MNYYSINIILTWVTLIILSVLVRENDRIARRDAASYYLTYGVIALAALAEWLGLRFNGDPSIPVWALQAVKCADYILTPLAGGALIAQLHRRSIFRVLIQSILAVNTAFQLAAVFSGWMITVDERHFYSHGPLYEIYIALYLLLIVLVVLLFTFQSAGMPVLLILVIQGAIWMNFGYPAIVHEDVFFMTQLVVSSIQMGANIDYAIVIGSRYTSNIRTMPRKEAIIEAMNFAFPTILTSGTILAASGVLISLITTECTINGIGEAIGRGTLISIVLVMFVLPQILLLGDRIIAKTSFALPKVNREYSGSGTVVVDGLVVGTIRGNVNGIFRGTVDGEADLHLLSGKIDAEEPTGGDPTVRKRRAAPRRGRKYSGGNRR